MARPKRNEKAAGELHRAVTRLARKRRIELSAKDVELWAFAKLDIKISDVTIQKVINGEADPTAVGLELLYVIREYLDAGPGELGKDAEARLTPIDRLAALRVARPGGGTARENSTERNREDEQAD